ncbi:MAG TPA: RDD family protein [Candidatus Acidoferrum sp.]|nr:RDD family protein [Candidatus Acidoferrum sp.]
MEVDSKTSTREDPSLKISPARPRIERFEYPAVVSQLPEQDTVWRSELAQRLEAYRSRRRKLAPNAGQSQFSFQESREAPQQGTVAMVEPPASDVDDFSFIVAIGRPPEQRVLEDTRMVIDVSLPPGAEANSPASLVERESKSQPGMHPVASIDDRRLAALIDFACLLFAYGGFLMLFSSLGGRFTLDKLSAAVYAASFATVYVQYFALFTVFGGTTPGMMMRSLQVVSFSGEPPAPSQMLLRSAGYILSAGTFFLGFLWAMWDVEELTWHDRLSRTYLAVAETFVDAESSSATHSR